MKGIFIYKMLMQGDVSLTFHDETFGKGFIDDKGILVGLERYFKTKLQL